MPKEHWRAIFEFPGYVINEYGQVKNFNSGKILKHIVVGTPSVRLFKEGKFYARGVRGLHRRAFPDKELQLNK